MKDDQREVPLIGVRPPITVVPSADSSDSRRLSALATVGEQTVRLATTANVPLAQGSTAWVPPATLVGLRSGREVVIYGDVSEVAVHNSREAVSLLRNWYPSRTYETSVHAPMAKAPLEPGARGVAAFFSGGVDSYYTTLKHLDEITHLIFIHGFDIDLFNEDLAERTLVAMRKSAAELGKQLIEVRTDVRVWLDRNDVDWGPEGFGPLLAHVGLALSDVVGKVYIPASHTEDDLSPLASHPHLDPLWSSDQVTFVHDGMEASRATKIRAFVESDAAMRHLRVCWWNGSNDYNCGECEKCVRTMLNLYIAGGLERCATLPDRISTDVIDRLHFNEQAKGFAAENLADLRAGDVENPELEAALQRVLDRSEFQNQLNVARTIPTGLRNMFTKQFFQFWFSRIRPPVNDRLKGSR